MKKIIFFFTLLFLKANVLLANIFEYGGDESKPSNKNIAIVLVVIVIIIFAVFRSSFRNKKIENEDKKEP